jgi:hypothetical protein
MLAICSMARSDGGYSPAWRRHKAGLSAARKAFQKLVEREHDTVLIEPIVLFSSAPADADESSPP